MNLIKGHTTLKILLCRAFVLVELLSQSFISHAQGPYTEKAPMPTPRSALCTAVTDGKIYAIGGLNNEQAVYSDVQIYDPATNAWKTKSNMPTARYSLSTCFVNGKIFAFGGWHASSGNFGDPMYRIVEEYDVNTNTWTRNTDMPKTIALLSTETVNGKIYLIGGTSRQHTFNSLYNVYEYDPHPDLLPLIENTNINSSYIQAGTGSVCIATKMRDTTGITLLAEIEAPDQSPIDSIKLFDDGMHGDGNAGDGLYANF
jgi:hypothetical protein